MSAVYIGAGIAHFLLPKAFARAVPPQLPRPIALVYLSGIAEIGLGLGVLFDRTRRLSAYGLIALLIAVFPANVYMAVGDPFDEAIPDRLQPIADAGAWLRLPLQLVLIAWASKYTNVSITDTTDNR